MNLRDRAWRDKMARMIARMDAHLRGDHGELDWETHARLRTIRDRLAGALGAEEGWTSTPELRHRAAQDYAEAAKVVGDPEATLVPPRGDPPEVVLARGFDTFVSAKPKRGDRC